MSTNSDNSFAIRSSNNLIDSNAYATYHKIQQEEKKEYSSEHKNNLGTRNQSKNVSLSGQGGSSHAIRKTDSISDYY